jgi:hypothetical protein
MKYAMLIYSDQSTWQGLSEEESARLRAESMPRWIALFEEIGKADPNVVGRELASASEAKVVRVVNGQTIVTDGPYAETKEQLGGYYLVTAADIDAAAAIGARIPGARFGAIEVREVMEFPEFTDEHPSG